MRLLWLPNVLRAAGLTVHEVSGWTTRGQNTYGPVRGITCHATAGSRNSTDQGEINVLLNGSETAPPPIAQLYLGRQGHWWVVASGLCYHNLVGWAGPNKGYGNDSLLGIEAANNNRDEPWPKVQYDSYVLGVAALVEHKAPGYDVELPRVAGHKEHQPYPPPPGTRSSKSDPTFNMSGFRADVAMRIKEGINMPTAQEIAEAVWKYDPNDPDQGGVLNPPWRGDAPPQGTNKTVRPGYGIYGGWVDAHNGMQAAAAALDAVEDVKEELRQLRETIQAGTGISPEALTAAVRAAVEQAAPQIADVSAAEVAQRLSINPS